jgi:hypothetical protein
MLRLSLPKSLADSLSPQGCDIADSQLGETLSALIMDPALDDLQCKAAAQMLRISFWEAFWIAAGEPKEAVESHMLIARSALQCFEASPNAGALQAAADKGRRHVYDWAGPNWRPGQI